MKLIQANIWGGRLEPQIINFIRAQKPDIVCLQEAADISGGNTSLFASIGEISEAGGLYHTFVSPVFSFNLMRRKADVGNAMLSRFPIVTKDTIFTGKKHIANFDFSEDDANIQNLQIAAIELPNNQIFHVLNHHGHHVDAHKDGNDETMRQCGLIVERIKELNNKRTIVCGDFNLSPHSDSLEQLNALLNNLSIQHQLKTTRTQLTHKSEVCDYIFVSDDIEVQDFTASDELISDHQALIMEFN